jgi:hypothetical protein
MAMAFLGRNQRTDALDALSGALAAGAVIKGDDSSLFETFCCVYYEPSCAMIYHGLQNLPHFGQFL